MKAGFLDEIVQLRNMGYGSELKSMKSIGYLELNEYIDGKISYDEAIEKIKTETKKYAKRQMTWYRRNKGIYWFKNTQINDVRKLLSSWLEDS